jgi:hypothetical protein
MFNAQLFLFSHIFISLRLVFFIFVIYGVHKYYELLAGLSNLFRGEERGVEHDSGMVVPV